MSAYKFKPKGLGNKKEDITTIDKKDFPELAASTVKKPDDSSAAGLKFLDKVMVVVAKDEANAAAIIKKKELANSQAAVMETYGMHVPSFDRYHQLVKERLEKEKNRWRRRRLYSSDEEQDLEDEKSVTPDDDFDSCEDWTDEEEGDGDTYDASEFDRHR
jgi:hypothetical protein